MPAVHDAKRHRLTSFILAMSSSMVAIGFTVHAGYFGKYSRHDDPPDTTEALAMLGTKKRPEVFSIATTAALITAAIAGIGTTLLVVRIAGSDILPAAYPAGAIVFVVLMLSFLSYERSRYRDIAD